MNRLHQISAYLSYWLNVVDEHSIHSPYFFDFYTKVIKSSSPPLKVAEQLRSSLLQNKSTLRLQDAGAGSQVKRGSERTIQEITRLSVSPVHISQLYARILKHINARYVVELGTSLGLNTLYLADHPDRKVITFEHDPTLASMALTHFEYAEKHNIQLITGNIDQTLPNFLQQTQKINFALLDANHRYEPTIRYFNLLQRRLNESSIVVIDDIHWSKEMEQAWKELARHELVYGSIDLFRCGILFFEPSLNRQHFVLSW